MSEPRKVLIVIPAYNEARRLPRLLREIRERMSAEIADGFSVRYLVVDDGSAPAESDRMARSIAENGVSSLVQFLRLEVNAGKGGAIHAGFSAGLRSDFDTLGFMDADGSVSISDLYGALRYIRNPARTRLAGVIGSRVQLLGRNVSRSFVRHYVGRAFASFVSILFGVPVYDTQCGLKLFRARVLRRYLDVPMDRRWVWDTELLMAMLRAGEAIHELPVNWESVAGSKVSFLRDPLAMAGRLIRFRFVLDRRIGDYGPKRNRSDRDGPGVALVLQDEKDTAGSVL